MFNFLKFFVGSYNDRMLKKYHKIVDVINGLEHEISSLSDHELQSKTDEFRGRLSDGSTLDDILPEAFAVVREASKRVLGMRHFDTQLIGGAVLHDGQIAEMKTGEGKTLVATLPVYLNALTGKGVHVVTVNDYLAQRDAKEMSRLYNFLKMSVGVSTNDMYDNRKKEAYHADITYCTNNTLGFDYLRDNLCYSKDDVSLRPFYFAIVDEVDSILIDEAKTPLILSGDADSDTLHLYQIADAAIKTLTQEDYTLEEKHRNVHLTESGNEKLEKILYEQGVIKTPHLYGPGNTNIVYHITCALKANKIFRKDVDYMVQNGQILIIDEYTGRVLRSNRYSEGIHQAIEAKEGVEIQVESRTTASITYQNLFKMYPKLAGMTGTAITEEAEFEEIYKLKVVSIPTNKPIKRIDNQDRIFTDQKAKYAAIVELIKERHARQQPILVGTCSLEKSEEMSALLKREGIPHNVLNAKQNEREAFIISEAGTPGCVTIATNMAGRGTDIKLGGNIETRIKLECQDIEDEDRRNAEIKRIKDDIEKKKEIALNAGGLLVIGAERNESRRIDDQLRGRSGRQGDPGESIFFFAFDDEMPRRFENKMLPNFLLKNSEELPQSKIFTNKIFNMQQRLCSFNFDIRKQNVKYDNVINSQRTQIYEHRNLILYSDDVSHFVFEMSMDAVQNIVHEAYSSSINEFDQNSAFVQKINENLLQIFGKTINIKTQEQENKNTQFSEENIVNNIIEQIHKKYNDIFSNQDNSSVQEYLRRCILMAIDSAWRDHLSNLNLLRKNVNYHAYAQQSPINVYQIESFNLFGEMLNTIRITALKNIFLANDIPTNDITTIDQATTEVEQKTEPIETSLNPDSNIEDYMAQIHQLTQQINEYLTQLHQNHNISIQDIINSKCQCGSGKIMKDCCGKAFIKSIPLDHGNISLPEITFDNNINLDGDFDDEEHYKGYEDEQHTQSINEKKIKLVDDKVTTSSNQYDKNDIGSHVDLEGIGPDNIDDYISKTKK